ncbi:MAG: hypothetical protein JWN93_3982 [Hyphomicrobiales bacterium]|nr:hypothetical protein [Hyphomicrobiales bacterium]
MRKSIIMFASLATLALFTGPASATTMTDQGVKNTCGKGLQTGSVGDTTAFGCDKKCGARYCTYNCCSGSKCGEQGCHGHVVGRVVGGTSRLPLPPAVVRMIKAAEHGKPGSTMPAHALKRR